MKIYTRSKLLSNNKVAEDIFDMVLSCKEIAENSVPGQFINMHVPKGELLLPRPISICEADKEKGTIRVLYKIMGKGTFEFSKLTAGEELYITGPLGNGFTIDDSKNIAVIGGGIGIPPLYELCREIRRVNPQANIKAFLGTRDDKSVILEEDFKGADAETFYATDDGSYGYAGNALNCFIENGFKADIIYACGPKIMLKFIGEHANKNNIKSQLSHEERMACGIGSCVCCVIKIKNNSAQGFEYKKVCKDGPVFNGEEVLWDA